MEQPNLKEYRCSCNKLLFKGVLIDCKIEIKCRRCGGIKTIGFSNGLNTENRLCSFETDKKQT
jgi:phage FluMu protein Com